MRVSTADFFSKAMSSFNNQESALVTLQEKISSGNSILTPSDDPIGFVEVLDIKNQVSQCERYLDNYNTAENLLECEDAILDAITKIYQRIKELIISSGNSTLSSTQRRLVSIEIKQRLDELIDAVNSKDTDGDYLFSGFKVGSPTVSRGGPGVFTFQGDEGQKSVMLGVSTSVRISDSGKDIFYNIPSSTVVATNTLGVASFTTPTNSLVNSGTLPALNALDLTINNVPIPASFSDTVSTTDAVASAIALVKAINSEYQVHGVWASANANSVDLGVYTPNALTNGQLVINGVSVIDAIGTEDSLLEAISLVSDITGVIATQPSGPGTAIILTADDGRNIQLQTQGSAAATFANFDLTGASSNEVMLSTINYRSHQPFSIAGAFPNHGGIVAGNYALSVNTGTGVVSTPQIVSDIIDTSQTYSIVFNAGGTSYSIFLDSKPTIALDGFLNVPYVPGEEIEFNGISLSISGTPHAGDIYGVKLTQLSSQSVFKTVDNIINEINSIDDPAILSYKIGIALSNMNYAEDTLLSTRSLVGARLNVLESQKNYLGSINVMLQKNLSEKMDLDYSRAITLLSQYTLALEASQQSFFKIQSINIFNYIR